MRLPYWLKQPLPDRETLQLAKQFSDAGVNTICQEANCPNAAECFSCKQVAFLILGDTCTRACLFCAVRKAQKQKLALDWGETERIAEFVRRLGIRYALITSVTRDDLPDGGAGQFVRAIEAIHNNDPQVKIEVLIPDLEGKSESLKKITDSKADVIAHNIETVRRLYPLVRPQADYELSLKVLRKVKEFNPKIYTKSSLMLGMGETEDEVIRSLTDLIDNKCDFVTLGQYLAPSASHYPVQEFIHPDQFERYRSLALNLGFKAVCSAPKSRSSYYAEDLSRETIYA